jgi:threonine/homoserine/homoserine lactone efflux protein
MHFDVLITFIFSSLVLTISPGPDIIYVISQSLVKGKKAAIITSLGLTTGLLFHTFFVVIGLSVLISENENIFFLLKMLGFFYFIYLAFMVFLKRKNKIDIKSNELENINFFKKGLLMNLLNPKVSLFFIALFPGFIFNDNLSSQLQFLILGLIFLVSSKFDFFFCFNIFK